MKLNKGEKNTETVTKTIYVRDVAIAKKKISKKRLLTKPSDELRELIVFEKKLPIEFKLIKINEQNFDKVKAELPDELQIFISDSNRKFEIDNYYALAETIRDLRRAANYLMDEVSRANESMLAFGDLSVGAFDFYLQQRAELNKKFPPKHKMFSTSGKRWLKHSPKAKETRDVSVPLFYAVPAFDTDFALTYKSSYLMEVLKGIDVRRLKICEKCSHVFWAFQLNQKYCDEVCQKRAKRSRSYNKNKEQK
jgi:hypothetical protein